MKMSNLPPVRLFALADPLLISSISWAAVFCATHVEHDHSSFEVGTPSARATYVYGGGSCSDGRDDGITAAAAAAPPAAATAAAALPRAHRGPFDAHPLPPPPAIIFPAAPTVRHFPFPFRLAHATMRLLLTRLP